MLWRDQGTDAMGVRGVWGSRYEAIVMPQFPACVPVELFNVSPAAPRPCGDRVRRVWRTRWPFGPTSFGRQYYGAATVMVQSLAAAVPVESTASAVYAKLPAAVGVPEMVPVVPFNVSPGGSGPAVIRNV
jgi:hypothetical protein